MGHRKPKGASEIEEEEEQEREGEEIGKEEGQDAGEEEEVEEDLEEEEEEEEENKRLIRINCISILNLLASHFTTSSPSPSPLLPSSSTPSMDQNAFASFLAAFGEVLFNNLVASECSATAAQTPLPLPFVIHPLEVAETLNAIFDVFAETDYNQIFVSVKFLPYLTNVYLPFLKQLVKKERNALDEHTFDRLDEAKINLVRFLSYKKKQFSK
eukprot:TRINITY_DN2852_c0_g3_i3.p3 TRINITY_DN2852_c0_g3~~TRINITY_DN2852_c0_g3_i3.p3  ORF type:complete len:213 (+),score=80.92 TRINITY_DN2852_c0_g3_i3:869-1507(+)